MTAYLEMVRVGDTFQPVFYVAPHQVLRGAALDTEQVVMVSPMAELIMQVTVLQ